MREALHIRRIEEYAVDPRADRIGEWNLEVVAIVLAALDRVEYAGLFRVLGDRYGQANAPHFKIPDFRGYFLRGLDPSGRIDPDGASRNVGSVQVDSFSRNTHKLMNNAMISFSYEVREGDKEHNVSLSTGVDRGLASITFEEVGGSETRPKNVSVNWIIRAR